MFGDDGEQGYSSKYLQPQEPVLEILYSGYISQSPEELSKTLMPGPIVRFSFNWSGVELSHCDFLKAPQISMISKLETHYVFHYSGAEAHSEGHRKQIIMDLKNHVNSDLESSDSCHGSR